ncbi:DUF6797 domain-containing protein [Novipirellula artificiosorum]|uniref:Cytochrome c domain-containing protein n=1 Tax=Novipirellula artificiosorum TaxID=2528016 RepID=A0A5C6DYX2_9BACT|nr:DUF6797 domain-containing protein [Novipirellula artificiosorum]TWU40611.1 hypothetical protein Poly41_14440 [Novipirellula artificiosorum]
MSQICRSRFFVFVLRNLGIEHLRFALVTAIFLMQSNAMAQSLHQRLLSEPVSSLAENAIKQGDARRGAILFHQPAIGCATCHQVDSRPSTSEIDSLAPDLTQLAKQPDATNERIVESILNPSAKIRNGFETISVLLLDGSIVSGFQEDPEFQSPDLLRVRDATTGKIVEVATDEIEETSEATLSTMPADIVNALASRQQFLDLAKYVIEIRDGGRERAKQLQPDSKLTALRLPEYEARVDHAGILRRLDADAMERGRQIYDRLCINCHGTLDAPGSLPTALRFAEGTFRGGSKPDDMYRTLTHGLGQMVPQVWMVPQQKYDVIHFIREHFLKTNNPDQLHPIDESYLSSLPTGDTLGPDPVDSQPWSDMDYGPWMFNTFEVGSGGSNIAQKGIAVRLDPGPGGIARGSRWLLFDHDTMRMAAGWSHVDESQPRFIDWQGIHFNGRHQVHPHVTGRVIFSNPNGPGWANPSSGSFDDDARVLGRDGKRYGPLPKSWAQYHGMVHSRQGPVIQYQIGDMRVLERADWLAEPTSTAKDSDGAFVRRISLGPTAQPQRMLIATAEPNDVEMRSDHLARVATGDGNLWIGMSTESKDCEFVRQQGRLCLSLPPSATDRSIAIWMTLRRESQHAALQPFGEINSAVADSLAPITTEPAAPLWPDVLTTTVKTDIDNGRSSGFSVDALTPPDHNPWLARLRFAGHDFFADGDRLAACTWDGDVYIVSGLSGIDDDPRPPLRWRRIASGLFQPLGLKIVEETIYLTCRDQIAILRDTNDDGETDFIECFNNDHQVTEHFHEFAMGLQRDAQGNFYYAKSARHALPAVVPHHGTLLKVTPDGTQTSILAVGFRAANGVCLNPDGSFMVTDQEGHWNPKNRINRVTTGGFYGNMFGYHDVEDTSDDAMLPPVCWITNDFDRSPAELLWVPDDSWGNLGGQLLNLSYGYGKVYTVPHQVVDVSPRAPSDPSATADPQPSIVQGGMCAFPIPEFPTGIMRGRFHPIDKQLYVCGLYAWASSRQEREGGLYRIRYKGSQAVLPTEIKAAHKTLAVTFSDPLDPASGLDVNRFAYRQWGLRRTEKYGSPHIDEEPLDIAEVRLSEDRRTVTLTIPELEPTWCYELSCQLITLEGESITRTIHGTLHALPDSRQRK